MSAAPPASGFMQALVGRRGGLATDLLIVFAAFIYVALFLAVRRATNACYFLLLFLALWHLLRHRDALTEAWRISSARLLVAALASPFVAAIAAKILRGEFDHLDLNSPARFLFAGLILLYLTAKRVQFVRIFALALPLAPIAAIALAPLDAEAAARWTGRFATAFVDPNTLGSYAVILTFMILLATGSPCLRPGWQRGLGYGGSAAGLLLAMLSASRGGWLAILPLMAIWVAFRGSTARQSIAWQGLAMLVIVAAFAAVAPEHAVRALDVVADVRGWLEGTNVNTAPGHRLSIWSLCLKLIAASPLTGYGWQGVVAALARPEFSAAASPDIVYILVHGGPHNDLLMMALSHGLFGIGAYAALLFVPAAFFWRRRAAATGAARLACELGLCLTVGVFFCSLTNEMLSLKYLVSFYSLTVAGLAAQVLGARPAASENR